MLSQDAPFRRSRSPDEFHSNKRKRRTKALSCYDCRRRKLGCDREYPSCSRCRKAGQADSCIYESSFLEPTSLPSKPLSDAPASKVSLQAKRIAQLESRLASLETSQPAATWQSFEEVEPVAKTSDKREIVGNGPFWTSLRGPTQPETILFRGKNYKTQYYGGTNPTSLIAHV